MSTQLTNRINEHFQEGFATKLATQELLLIDIKRAAELMARCLRTGHKILSCGNGGSAADAQHFSAELMGRFERERRPLPAIALTTNLSNLTAVANDYSYEKIFSKQVKGLGNAGDLLMAISTSGNSKNVIFAIQAAKDIGMNVIALTGNKGGMIKDNLSGSDINLCVPSERTARIQETHLLLLHILCDAVDCLLFDSDFLGIETTHLD